MNEAQEKSNEVDISNCSCMKDCRQDGDSHKPKILYIGGWIILFIICLVLLHTQYLDTNLIHIMLIIIYICAGLPIFYAFYSNCKNKIFFDENTLMLFATLAAICIGEISEAVAVILFFRVGEILESITLRKSKNSINALLDIMPHIAHKKVEHNLLDIDPKLLQIGDLITVKVGEKIPADGIIVNGKSYVDMRSLNGESVPVGVDIGDYVMAGAINNSAVLEINVKKPFLDSHIAQIAKLTQEASTNKAKTQRLISSFASVYTPIIFATSILIACIPPLFNGEWQEWIYRGLVVMMISCPCALVVSVPLSHFAAIGWASKNGILFKGSIYLESLWKVKNIVFDKTGTLTLGTFEILSIYPQNGYTNESLLSLAAYAEQNSNHPIATCIKNHTNLACNIESYEEIGGKGVHMICEKGEILAGNATLLREFNIAFKEENSPQSIIYLAHNKIYAGYILIGDKLKDEVAVHLQSLKKYGIKNYAILSGDNQANVDYMAKNLGIEHAFGNLLPAQKEQKFLEISSKWNGKSAFVGDGINDSVVLRRADVGISIHANDKNNDMSKESSDIILCNSSLQTLVYTFAIASHAHTITRQNISFAIISKLVLIALGIMGIANMWLAVFGDVGVALLCLLNAMKKPHLK